MITVDVAEVGARRWMKVSGLRRRFDVLLTVLSWEKEEALSVTVRRPL
jgi:hypothetical protein